MIHDNLIVILVEPQGPLNVGSVCRIMMNFGFKNLRLVNPCKDYQSEQARKMALSAQTMLIEAKIFNTLADALADCHIAFGTTRRFGKYRKNFFTPEPAGKYIASSINSTINSGINNNIDDTTIQCALVLGREDNGLNGDQLALCHHFITIPTDDAFPSMNLSHALGILLYETAKAMTNLSSTKHSTTQSVVNQSVVNHSVVNHSVTNQFTTNQFTTNQFATNQFATNQFATNQFATNQFATIEVIEQMYSHMKKTLCDIEFLDPQNPDHLLRTFRRIFGKAGLMNRDVRIIRGLMSKIEWIESQRKKRKTNCEKI